MRRSTRRVWCAAGIALAFGSTAQAQIVAQWNFNSTTPDANTATGVTTPSIGSGTASLAGGTTATFAAGSPGDPASAGSDNSGWNSSTYPAQGAGSGTSGTQFAVSTAGFTGAFSVYLDFRQSGTASRYWQLQASSDGTTFNPVSGGTGAVVGPIGAGNTLTNFDNSGTYVNNSGGGSQTFVQSIRYTFPAGSGFQSDANFAFRWLAIFDQGGTAPGNYISSNAGTSAAYASAGTARFDMVTVDFTPVPEPASLTLLGAAGAVISWGIRRRSKSRVTDCAKTLLRSGFRERGIVD